MGPDGKWPLDFDYPSAGEILIVYWPFFFFFFFLVSIVWNGKVLSFVEKKSSIYIYIFLELFKFVSKKIYNLRARVFSFNYFDNSFNEVL